MVDWRGVVMPECKRRIFLQFCFGARLAPIAYHFIAPTAIPFLLNGLVILVNPSNVLLQSHALEDYNSQFTYTSTYN